VLLCFSLDIGWEPGHDRIMPRQARIDAPGALHHVMLRGINREKLFRVNGDYGEFLSRLGALFQKNKVRCLAWSLMPNHVHLLVQTGDISLSRVMQKLLTGYAGWFNRRHERAGRLYQNRFKSVLCDREQYLLELARYIHLNPLRAGLVRDMRALAGYPWCGHGVVLGKRQNEWQEVDLVLERFGKKISIARVKYEEFVAEGVKDGRRRDLVGGGLLRSAGGYVEYMNRRRRGEEIMSDERILGDSDFVNEALKRSESQETFRSRARRIWSQETVMKKAAQVAGVDEEHLIGNGKLPKQCKGRALACHWLVDVLGMRAVEAAVKLGITQSVVSRNVIRGRAIAGGERIKLPGA